MRRTRASSSSVPHSVHRLKADMISRYVSACALSRWRTASSLGATVPKRSGSRLPSVISRSSTAWCAYRSRRFLSALQVESSVIRLVFIGEAPDRLGRNREPFVRHLPHGRCDTTDAPRAVMKGTRLHKVGCCPFPPCGHPRKGQAGRPPAPAPCSSTWCGRSAGLATPPEAPMSHWLAAPAGAAAVGERVWVCWLRSGIGWTSLWGTVPWARCGAPPTRRWAGRWR